jgi:hypothetical protein
MDGLPTKEQANGLLGAVPTMERTLKKPKHRALFYRYAAGEAQGIADRIRPASPTLAAMWEVQANIWATRQEREEARTNGRK